MKSVVFLGDGMADLPIPELGGRTPLEAASHPGMDFLAGNGLFGMTKTVPLGMPPGSDTANLAVFGYDPRMFYSGRSPLEAVSMGIPLNVEDVTYRCNLVTLSDEENITERTMVDYSSGEITTAESTELIRALQPVVEKYGWELYPGISYRHCLVIRGGETGAILTPPHDISRRVIGDYLPKGHNGERFLDLMAECREILISHPVNLARIAAGKNPATSIWLWGEGRKPALPTYPEKFGIQKGAVISAVDLIRGIGRCAGLEVIEIPGITGNYHTDFAAKGRAAIEAFRNGAEFVYIHVEAPDECGHHGERDEKVWSIEQIDEKIICPVLEYLRSTEEEFSALVMPDHPTPLALLTHTAEPIPFALYHSTDQKKDPVYFSEKTAAETGVFIEEAHTLMPRLLSKSES